VKYRATFSHLGRSHDLIIDAEGETAEGIAGSLYFGIKRGRYLVSKDVQVVVDLDELKGWVYAGFHSAGTCTLEAVPM